MKTFCAIIIVSILTGFVAQATPRKDYDKFLEERKKIWTGLQGKIVGRDKSFCAAEKQTSFSTCFRAYVLGQSFVPVASDYLYLTQTSFVALKEDLKVKLQIITERGPSKSNSDLMDDATMMIYGLETILKSRLDVSYKNSFCEKDITICEIENKAFAYVFPVVIKTFEDSFRAIEESRKKESVSASTKAWQEDKLQTISGLYRPTYLIPQGSIVATAPTPVAPKIGGGTGKVSREEELKQVVAELTNIHAQIYDIENPKVRLCFRWTKEDLKNQMSEVVDICNKRGARKKAYDLCIKQQMTIVVMKQISRLPASEQTSVQSCIYKKQ